MIVWSYGGGTQSAAIAALIMLGELPRPDLIVMVDTGREVSETWQYLNDVIRPSGFDVEIIPHEYAKYDLIKGGYILLPMYTRQGGRIGKMPTFCSNEWKKYPMRRWLRERGVNDCDVWLGISLDEERRAKPSGAKWYRHVFPLIEMRPTHRRECYNLVKAVGWPRPPKSRCWMCPNQSLAEWKDLKDRYPADFAKAIALEKSIQEIDGGMFLHEYAIPLEDAVVLSESQMELPDV